MVRRPESRPQSPPRPRRGLNGFSQASEALPDLQASIRRSSRPDSCSSCMNSSAKCSPIVHQCTVNSNNGACMFTLEKVSSGGQNNETVYATCVENFATCRTGPISLTVGTDKQVRTNSMCCQSNLCNQNITMAVNSTNTTLILKGCATQSACELQISGIFYYSQQTYTLTKASCVPATSKGSNAAIHALAFFPTLAGLLLVKQLS
ncbi:hypothetical protein KIL84_005990 [Mauremys mutica]|uniref:UPAR/Ly6 domain-containing protein n=1 Tax=Mauremys mutica TaxID=74926 RepID=A0A9D4B4H9_9SAUR|nr:hypothetical protein KIL84_005990 [Mauremys mutica]